MGGINMEKLIQEVQLLNADGEMITRDVRITVKRFRKLVSN